MPWFNYVIVSIECFGLGFLTAIVTVHFKLKRKRSGEAEEPRAKMTPQEIQVVGLQEQIGASMRDHLEDLRRIARDGPNDTDFDHSLCRKMSHSIVGDLMLSEYRVGENADSR